jgi:hypothetical protein
MHAAKKGQKEDDWEIVSDGASTPVSASVVPTPSAPSSIMATPFHVESYRGWSMGPP